MTAFLKSVMQDLELSVYPAKHSFWHIQSHLLALFRHTKPTDCFDGREEQLSAFRVWMEALVISADSIVDMTILSREYVVGISFGDFCRNLGQLWHPSSDDLCLYAPKSLGVVLVDHEEHITLWDPATM